MFSGFPGEYSISGLCTCPFRACPYLACSKNPKAQTRLLVLKRIQRDGRNSRTALGFIPNQFNSCIAPGLDWSKTILNSNLVPVVSTGLCSSQAELKMRCRKGTWEVILHSRKTPANPLINQPRDIQCPELEIPVYVCCKEPEVEL